MFYKRCNDLDKYLLERGYIEKMVRKEILPARVIARDTLLEKFNNLQSQYHPVFRVVRKILEELHVILRSDDRLKKVFLDVPMIGFKINKNLKLKLVR